MLQSNSTLIDKIEKIQERSLLLLGEDLDIVLKHITGSGNKSKSARNENTNEKLKQLLDNWYLAMPENRLLSDEDVQKEFFTAGFTKYDNSNFLSRFANTKELLHKIFADNAGIPRLNIDVSTLPFLTLNGVCCKLSSVHYLVFINEGILALLPGLFREYLPTIAPQYFGHPRKGYFARLMGLFLQVYASGRGGTGFGGKIQYLSGGEKWYFSEWLRYRISNENNININDFTKPHKMPLTQQSAQFYAIRGASTFLLAHEFAHAYSRHSDLRAMVGVSARTEEEIRRAGVVMQKARINGSQIEKVLKGNKGFLVSKPTEVEADAHAMQAVFAYCGINDLSEAASECVILGALSTFAIWELYDRLIMMTKYGYKSTNQELSQGSELLNIIYDCDHPVPISRPMLMTRHAQADSWGVLKDSIASISNDLKIQTDILWQHIEQHEEMIVSQMKQSPYLTSIPNDLFDGLHAVGGVDFCNPVRKIFGVEE